VSLVVLTGAVTGATATAHAEEIAPPRVGGVVFAVVGVLGADSTLKGATRMDTPTLVGTGIARVLISAMGILVGATSTSSSANVVAPADVRPVRTQLPALTWARAELPRTPNHATLLELRF